MLRRLNNRPIDGQLFYVSEQLKAPVLWTEGTEYVDWHCNKVVRLLLFCNMAPFIRFVVVGSAIACFPRHLTGDAMGRTGLALLVLAPHQGNE